MSGGPLRRAGERYEAVTAWRAAAMVRARHSDAIHLERDPLRGT